MDASINLFFMHSHTHNIRTFNIIHHNNVLYLLQYPLNTGNYTSLLQQLDQNIQEQTKSIGTLPKAQLDPLDLSGKIAPCCNHDNNCTCSAATTTTAVPFTDGAAGIEYGPASHYYRGRWF